MRRWLRRASDVLYLGSAATRVILLLRGISTARQITNACGRYAAPASAVIDESNENAALGTIAAVPFAVDCSYSTGGGEE